MDKLRKIFVAAMICLVVSTIAVYAIGSFWTKTFNWAVTNKSFAVYTDAAHAQLWTQGSEALTGSPVSNGSTVTKDFYITNDGNVQITVNPMFDDSSGTFTPSWNGSLTLNPLENGTLRLTLANILNDGSYHFHFNAP